MSNSRLSKQGQVVSMQDTFTTAKTKLGRTKPLTGPPVGHSWSRPTHFKELYCEDIFNVAKLLMANLPILKSQSFVK